MLDQALEALKTYDWGTDRAVLNPIEDAIIQTAKDPAARKALEAKLAAVLKTEVSHDAKDWLCRKLLIVGTADSVPNLASLLADEKLSHMGRYALEGIPGPEAAQALRDALPKVSAKLKVGIISSLGARKDAAAVAVLGPLLNDSDAAVARAAALALGQLRTAEAAQALASAKPSDAGAKSAATDAKLACAEGLLAAGKKAEALLLYKSLAGDDQAKHVKLAATRGMLACAGQAQ
jgi:HEAT repeat protein